MELTTLLNGTQLVPQNVYKFQFQVKHFQLIGNFFPDFETFWYQAIHTLYDYMLKLLSIDSTPKILLLMVVILWSVLESFNFPFSFRQDAFVEKVKTIETDDTEKEVAEWLQQLDGGRGALVAW